MAWHRIKRRIKRWRGQIGAIRVLLAQKTEHYAGAIQRSLILQWTLFAASAAACLYYWRNTPSPGAAIGILAAVAACMAALRMRETQKLLWLVIVLVLCFIEIRAIGTQDQENTNKWNIEQQRFEATALALKKSGDGIAAAIAEENQIEDQTKSINTQTRETATLAGNSLMSLTGGDSWGWVGTIAFLNSENLVGLSVGNAGKRYPLRAVKLMILDRTQGIALHRLQEFYIGDIPPNSGSPAPQSDYLMPDPNLHNEYYIIISALNGSVSEKLWLDKAKTGGWTEKGEVYRVLPTGKTVPLKSFP
jgi:hypothetical protein